MMVHATLLVASKSFQWVGVHRLGLKLFGATVWKLLIIEPFSQWKLNKIEIENYIGIWGHLWCCWKTFGESNLINYFTIFKAKVWTILFVSVLCCWKLKTMASEGNFGWVSICSHLANDIYYVSSKLMWNALGSIFQVNRFPFPFSSNNEHEDHTNCSPFFSLGTNF
jgi:hypothetical protein